MTTSTKRLVAIGISDQGQEFRVWSPVAATTFNAGWDVYFMFLPPGRVIRSNEALAGWKAAREEAAAVDVDYR